MPYNIDGFIGVQRPCQGTWPDTVAAIAAPHPAGAVQLQWDMTPGGGGKLCLSGSSQPPTPTPPPAPPPPPPPAPPTPPRPPIKNLGSVDVGSICEQTPVIVGDAMWRFESVHAAYHGSLTPGSST